VSIEHNKSLVHRLFSEFYRGNVDVADEIFAAQVELNDSGKSMTVTPEDLKNRQRAQMAAMPDGTMTLEDVVAEDDRVAYRWTMRGTQTGPMRGIPPTGKSFVMSGMTVMRIADGKIVAGWHNFDMVGMLQQLGVIPSPAQR
jgi:steroid delta-isomerase-like uncharacterized protein